MKRSDEITVPEGLLPSEEAEYCKLAEKLESRGMFDALDCDTLARYVQVYRNYRAYQDALNLAVRNEAEQKEVAGWQRLQDTAFKQCRACAQDLGLTVTARAKLDIPFQDDGEDYEL